MNTEATAVAIQLPTLAKGELYKGIVLDADNKPAYHLVLLPGQVKKATHAKAIEWASKQGGRLPDRRDGALLYANNADAAFDADWYWLEPRCAGYESYAWVQFFGLGDQDDYPQGIELRARAVRRVAI